MVKLNEIKDFQTVEMLFEMANLDEKYTGIDFGIVYASTDDHIPGPRIKFYRKTGKHAPYATFTIADQPELLKKASNADVLKDLKPKEIEKIIEFIKLNKEKLLHFWNEGTTMIEDEKRALLDSFTHVS